MKEAFFDLRLYRYFPQMDAHGHPPDASTIFRFRHQLVKHKLVDEIFACVNRFIRTQSFLLRAGMPVDATLIAMQVSLRPKAGKPS